MSSNKRSRDGSGKKPSVFERLGSKALSQSTTASTSTPSTSEELYCKQWAHKGSCSYGSKCKFIQTHNNKNKGVPSSSGKEGRSEKRSRSRSLSNRHGEKDRDRDGASSSVTRSKNVTSSSKSGALKTGRYHESDTRVNSGDLDQEDEMLALERKREMLQRELARQEEQEHKQVKTKKPQVKKKRVRSSSSSSTSSSSSSDSSSGSTDSSSSSTGSSTSSSSSSSDSDGEVKEKKSSKKKSVHVSKRSRSSSSGRVPSKLKTKAKPRKREKISPHEEMARKKDASSFKKYNSSSQRLSSPARHSVSSSSVKHLRESPSYSPAVRSRSPRLKESSDSARRLRRSPDLGETKRKSATASSSSRELVRRREDHSPSSRPRSRERKAVPSSSSYEARGAKLEKQRERLLEPGYMVRARSPTYRDPPYPVRECSPIPSFRDRPRPEAYDSRRVYSPPPVKLERKEDPYDGRSARRVSPEAARRSAAHPKDFHDYDRDWPPADDPKLTDWDHRESEYRRRNRLPADDISWNRLSSAPDSSSSWRKSYSPPKSVPAAYPDSHGVRGNWEPSLTKSRTEEHRKDRERRAEPPTRRSRSRDSRRPALDESSRPKGATSGASTTEEASSPTSTLEPAPKRARSVVRSDSETEEAPVASSAPPAADVDEAVADSFSDFSDDVDEILNRDESEPAAEKSDEAVISDAERCDTPVELESEPAKMDVLTGSDPSAISPSAKAYSPVASPAVDGRVDDDLLGGMDIEQISDEEFEEESKAAPVDALDVDWASLACRREKKPETGVVSARQRWEGKKVLARLGITRTSITHPQQRAHGAGSERKPLFSNSLFRRALSARMDLSLRRTLCNLPGRELIIDNGNEDDMTLYKSSVDLLLREVAAAH